MRIGLMRQEESSLTYSQREQLKTAFPDEEIEFFEMDSKNAEDHNELCGYGKDLLVILPGEQPIPAIAMMRGIPHVRFGENGLEELLPMEVKFKPFVP